jgi:hypothetical protein
VTVQNISDPQLYRYINISYHEIENAIVTNLDEDFFWNEITGSLVANQSEYTNDTLVVGNISGTNKVIDVALDYDGNGTYITASPTSGDNLDRKRRESVKNDPLYRIMDNSVEIFPTPLISRTNGLKMRVIQNLIDITPSTIESSIFNGKIHANNHFFIAL